MDFTGGNDTQTSFPRTLMGAWGDLAEDESETDPNDIVKARTMGDRLFNALAEVQHLWRCFLKL